jgi:hypothetical protein
MSGSIWLILGTAAGALVALLLGPPRDQARLAALRVEPYVELQKLHAEWRARIADAQDQSVQR